MADAEVARMLAQCVAEPENDEPRLVWADAVGGERGELVVLQCQLARGGRSPEVSGTLRRRQRELLEQHGRAWAGLAGLATYSRFRRGFVEVATFEAATFCDHSDEIFAIAPFLRSVVIAAAPADDWRRLFDHPGYARLRGLGLRGISGPPEHNDEVIAFAVAHHAFARLESLDVYRLGPVATHELVASNQLRALTRLVLGPSGVVGDGLPALFATMPNLRALDMRHLGDTTELVPALPPRITELMIHVSAFAALARSPIAANLERLTLYDLDTTGALPELAAFPKLRSLDIYMRTFREEVVLGPGFAATPLPALRELRCRGISLDGARAVAEAIGAQLELFHVIGFHPGLDIESARPRVAGDLFADLYMPAAPPLFAGELPEAPMWDYPYVHYPPASRAT